MSTIDFSTPPYSFFSPPGSIEITPAAMKLARDFSIAARQVDPQFDWVIVFEWFEERRVRENATSQWIDLGAGLDLGAYAPQDIPPGVTCLREGMSIVLKIPATIRQSVALKRIDVTEGGTNKLRLE